MEELRKVRCEFYANALEFVYRLSTGVAGRDAATKGGGTDMADGSDAFRVPSLIKRNTALFALSQTFTGAGMQFAYGFGPLMVMHLSGSAALAGMSIALLGFSRFLIAYPIGRITDAYGRKPGIMLGLVLALVGALVNGLSMQVGSFALLFIGMLIFAMGMNAAQQLRVAATALIADAYDTEQRGRAIGVNESIAGGTSMVMALVTGPIIQWGGLPATGLAAVLIALPPLLLRVALGAGSRVAARP